MNVHAQPPERREALAVARRYRRDGYKVTGPEAQAGRSSFLGDFVPDLIAERDDDKVIVEVKRAPTLRGANDIVEIAELVSAQPGWRFELIAVPAAINTTMPDLTEGGEDVRRLLDKGFLKPAFVVVCAMIENLVAVAIAAVRQNRNPASSAFPALVRDLVVRGVIDDDTRRKIDDAQVLRNAIVRGQGEVAPTRSDVEALLRLGHDLQRDVLAIGESSGRPYFP